MPFAKSCARAVHTPLVLSCGSDPGQYHSIKTIELTNGTRHPIQISRRCACDREFTMLRLETERQYTQGSERAGDAPGRIRTSDQQLRRLLLYPPELRARERLTQFCDSDCLPYVRQTSACQPSRSTA